jgi:hypothetical protein
MEPITNNEALGMPVPKTPDLTTNNTIHDTEKSLPSTVQPMQELFANKEKERGMNRALCSTSGEDRAAITQALLAGFDPATSMRAEDALKRVAFEWPVTANPRSLGAIVSHLSRMGLIIEDGWTKGRSGRSHAGRVSLWRKSSKALGGSNDVCPQ